MKALSVLLALSCSSIAIASSSHQLHSNANGHGMRMVKRQAVGGGSATTSQGSGGAAAASQPSNVASSPSNDNNNNNNNNSPLDSLTQALQSSSSSSPATSQSTTDPLTSPQEQSSTSNEQETQTSQTPSSSSSVAPVSHPSASTSPSSVAPSSAPTTNARSTVISIVTPSSSPSSTETDESSSSSSSSSSSPTALSDKKASSSSSGGIGHGTLIAIIVVASCVAGVAAIWTIIRKTAFSPSKRFESKLEPIDFVPEVPQDHNRHHHDRSQSQLSGAYGFQRGGDGGYEASLARSDSKSSLKGQGMVMSESGGGLASIPYQGPGGGYVQPAYYGETANAYHGSPQLGYPHEQPTYYPALQRGLSSSSSLQHQASGLGRMNTTGGAGGGAPAYDYAAHARSAGGGGGGHHQYY